MSLNEEVVHFTIASCVILTIFPMIYFTYLYEQLLPTQKEQIKFSCSMFNLLFPITYGIVFAIMYRILFFIPRKFPENADSYSATYVRFVFSGAFAILIISFVVDYFYNIYSILEMDAINAHAVLFVYYLFLFYTIGSWLRLQILYGPAPKKTSYSSYPSSPSISSSFPKPVENSNTNNVSSGNQKDDILKIAKT